MQQMIDKQIGDKIHLIVKQNEKNLLTQKQELGKIISQQKELLNRSINSQIQSDRKSTEDLYTPQTKTRKSNSLLPLNTSVETTNSRL
jgi:hypothetical protein